MTFHEELKERVLLRKAIKKEFDERIDLSATRTNTDDEWLLLLDEGLQTWADGSPRFYLEKGALREYYDNLSADFTGVVNLGHAEHAVFPYPLGSWSKADLELRDAGNGREALYVRPKIDYDSVFIRELARNGEEVGLSAEFTRVVDEINTQKFGFPFFSSVNIDAIGIVGDCGAVNAFGVQLKGETDMTFNMSKLAEESKGISLEQLSDKIDGLLKENAVSEQPEAATEEPVVEEVTEETVEEVVEETADPIVTDEQDAQEEAPAAEEDKGEENVLASVLEKVEALNAQVQELIKEKESLSAQLKEKVAMEDEFMSKLHKLSTSLAATGRDVTPDVDDNSTTSVYTDGIGAV